MKSSYLLDSSNVSDLGDLLVSEENNGIDQRLSINQKNNAPCAKS